MLLVFIGHERSTGSTTSTASCRCSSPSSAERSPRRRRRSRSSASSTSSRCPRSASARSALAIFRRETGIMAVSCLVIFVLALRAAGTTPLDLGQRARLCMRPSGISFGRGTSERNEEESLKREGANRLLGSRWSPSAWPGACRRGCPATCVAASGEPRSRAPRLTSRGYSRANQHVSPRARDQEVYTGHDGVGTQTSSAPASASASRFGERACARPLSAWAYDTVDRGSQRRVGQCRCHGRPRSQNRAVTASNRAVIAGALRRGGLDRGRSSARRTDATGASSATEVQDSATAEPVVGAQPSHCAHSTL